LTCAQKKKKREEKRSKINQNGSLQSLAEKKKQNMENEKKNIDDDMSG